MEVGVVIPVFGPVELTVLVAVVVAMPVRVIFAVFGRVIAP